MAAFDASPLNACRLRALYRTLLTIDFAAPTNERPDPTRAYTDDQWYAYRRQQLGGRAMGGHEVVDIFWLSPAVSSLESLCLLLCCFHRLAQYSTSTIGSQYHKLTYRPAPCSSCSTSFPSPAPLPPAKRAAQKPLHRPSTSPLLSGTPHPPAFPPFDPRTRPASPSPTPPGSSSSNSTSTPTSLPRTPYGPWDCMTTRPPIPRMSPLDWGVSRRS